MRPGAAVIEANDAMAAQGLRVLGVARRALPPGQVAGSQEETEAHLVFLGLVGHAGPATAGGHRRRRACRRAGIRIVMVTGDHPLTAEAVARRVGIVRRSGAHAW